VERPQPTEERPQHLYLDKGYDNPTGHETVATYQYTPHIRRIGEEKLDPNGQQTYPAHRWVVERTLAWLSKCRGLLVRYEKRPSIFSVCCNWPVPCYGCDAGHDSSVIEIVTKAAIASSVYKMPAMPHMLYLIGHGNRRLTCDLRRRRSSLYPVISASNSICEICSPSRKRFKPSFGVSG